MKKVGYECRVMGVPKTIDNDLFGTDHCPGFASAAKYIATSVMEIARDARVYNVGQITVIECMGRHAGWLTAAASLPQHERALLRLYLPARGRLRHGQVHCRRFRLLQEKRLAASSPSPRGIHYCRRQVRLEAKTSGTDGFGHAQLGGLAALLPTS